MIKREIINEYIKNKKKLIPLVGKVPIVRDWTNKTVKLDKIYNYNNNIGWVLDENDLIIDVDPKNGGNDSIKKLLKDTNIKIDEINPIIQTPSGGFHCYLYINQQDLNVKKTIKQYPGIDFLHKGSMAVILGSFYKDKFYEVYNKKKKFKFLQFDCPKKILNIIIEKNSKTKLQEFSELVKYNFIPKNEIQNILSNLNPSTNYTEWLKIGMALHSWDQSLGLDLWEAWSKNGTNYCANETHKKWKTFNKSKNITVGTLYYMNKNSKNNKNTTKTIEITPNSVTVPFWCTPWIFVISKSIFFNIETMEAHTQISFNHINGKYIPKNKSNIKPSAVKYVCDNGFIENVSNCQYLPYTNKKLLNISNKKVVNIFDSSTLPAIANKYSIKGSIAIKKIKKHINFLFEQKKDSEIFTYWLAHQIQYPGIKILWAPILCSIQGAGKSFLGEILKKCLGNNNIGVVSPSQVTSDFNGWAKNVIVNILEELRIKGNNRFEAINALKPLITDKHIQINEKCVKQHMIENVTNYICFTNEKDAIVFDKNDRRWWVVFAPIDDLNNLEEYVSEKKDTYFINLFNALYENVGEIKKWLVEISIPEWFLKMKQAPMTEYKESMLITENLNIPWFFEIKDFIKKGGEYYNENVICCKNLFDCFSKKNYNVFFQTIQKNNILKKLGYIPLPKNIKINGKTRRIWSKKIISNEKVRKHLNL